ncbi:MAG: acyl-CoA thioester hydrolase/BAAT C-terminal domain-containing protein [Corynebacterium sp.]|nr:acyl-CoA thioester hydrolase/BAAT C-terminal domain-containing protein [Corynebacterium sp.]
MEISLRPISAVNSSLGLVVSDVEPGDTVRVKVETTDATGRSWGSESEFSANAEGMVDIDAALPHSAAWEPANSLGCLWAMNPERTDSFVLSGDTPVSVELKIRSSKEGRGAHAQRTVARNVDEFNHPKQHATGFIKKGEKPLPLVVLFNDAGLPGATAGAALLADMGLAVVAYDYSEAKKIDGIRKDIEEIRRADRILVGEPMAFIGIGKGAEIALIMADRFGDAVGPVIAHNPPNHITPSLDDKPHDSWKDLDTQGTMPDKSDVKGRLREASLKALPVNLHGLIEPTAGNELPLANIAGPVLVTAGTADAVWDSESMAASVVKDLEENDVQVFHMTYEHAGHGTGFPFSMPGVPCGTTADLWGTRTDLGGSRMANSARSVDSMEQVTSMLSSYYGI